MVVIEKVSAAFGYIAAETDLKIMIRD